MNHRLLPLAILCLAFSPAAMAADEAPNPLKEAFQLAAKGDMEGAAKIIKKEEIESHELKCVEIKVVDEQGRPKTTKAWVPKLN